MRAFIRQKALLVCLLFSVLQGRAVAPESASESLLPESKKYGLPADLMSPSPPTVPSLDVYKSLNDEVKSGPFPPLDKTTTPPIIQPSELSYEATPDPVNDPLPMVARGKGRPKRSPNKGGKGTPCPPALVHCLEDALESAYFLNVDLENQRVNLKLMVEEMSRTLAEWRPSISLRADQSLEKSRANQLDTAPIFPAIGENLPVKNRRRVNNGAVSLQATQNLYSGGGTMARNDKAQEKFRAALFQLAAQEQITFAKVIDAYVDVIVAEEVLTMERKNEFYLTEILRQTEMRYDIGDQTVADVSIAKAKLATAVAQVATAVAQVQSKRADLVLLINVPLAKNLTMPEFYEQLPKTLDDLKQVSLRYYPPLIAAIHAEKAARFEVANVTSRFLPNVEVSGSLTPSQRWVSNRNSPTFLENAQQETRRAANVNVALVFPIYDRGTTHSQYRTAEQEVKQAKLQVELQRRNIIEQCTLYFANFEAAKNNVAASKVSLDANKIALEASRTEFALGMKQFLDVMQIEEHWRQSYREYIRSMADLVKSSYHVLQMTGKLMAKCLALNVELYDPCAYYERYVDSLWSLGEDEEKKNPFGPCNKKEK